MEALLESSWIGFVLVGLGTFFLLGEILVNIRGIGAIIGIFSVTFYFYTYMPDLSNFIMMLIVYLIGLGLILLDGKFINDGTIATIGIASMILSIVLTAPNFTAGLYAVLGLLFGAGGSFLLLKIFKPRNMWGKLH